MKLDYHNIFLINLNNNLSIRPTCIGRALNELAALNRKLPRSAFLICNVNGAWGRETGRIQGSRSYITCMIVDADNYFIRKELIPKITRILGSPCVHFGMIYRTESSVWCRQICAPLTIALCPALLAASTLQPCRNAILLLSVSPSAPLLPLDSNPVEMQFFYSQLKEEHTSGCINWALS